MLPWRDALGRWCVYQLTCICHLRYLEPLLLSSFVGIGPPIVDTGHTPFQMAMLANAERVMQVLSAASDSPTKLAGGQRVLQ